MYRDVALKSFQRIPYDEKKRVVPLFVAANDIDNDKLEELVVFGEFGDLLIYKNESTYTSSALASPLPLSDFNIFIFDRHPTIILLSIDGSLTMTECTNLMPNYSVQFSHITRVQTGLWNCLCVKPFMWKSNCYIAVSAESTIAVYRYDSIGKTIEMQLKFALSGRIHSIGALSSRFLIAGSSTGSVDVISLWKDNDSQEIEDTFEATSIPVRVGCQPPLPNADGLSASIGPVTIIRGLSRYNPTNQSTCMFALAWVDGRICICNLAKNPKSNLSESEPSHLGLSLPLNYSWDWRVIQTFHTKYSLFRLDYVRFKSAIDQPKSSVQSTTVDDLSYSEHKYQDLELNWQSVHGDIEEEETSDHQACEEAYIVASSHTGHTLFITVLPSDLGESTSAADDHQIRKIFSFDSRHSLHGEIVRYIAIGRLNHISPAQNCPLQSSDETPAINSFSMVYLTSSGDIWIVNNLEWELAILGPPIIPSIRFSPSDIDRANRIVRMWNIMRSGPVSKGDVIDSAQQDGVQLIQRLLSTSLTDLKRMVEETSLDSWHRSHS